MRAAPWSTASKSPCAGRGRAPRAVLPGAVLPGARCQQTASPREVRAGPACCRCDLRRLLSSHRRGPSQRRRGPYTTARLGPRHGSSSPYSCSITAVTAITEICPYPPPILALHRGREQARACRTDEERVPQKVVIAVTAVTVYRRKRDSGSVFAPIRKGWVGSLVWVCRALLTEGSLHPELSTLNRRRTIL